MAGDPQVSCPRDLSGRVSCRQQGPLIAFIRGPSERWPDLGPDGDAGRAPAARLGRFSSASSRRSSASMRSSIRSNRPASGTSRLRTMGGAGATGGTGAPGAMGATAASGATGQTVASPWGLRNKLRCDEDSSISALARSRLSSASLTEARSDCTWPGARTSRPAPSLGQLRRSLATFQPLLCGRKLSVRHPRRDPRGPVRPDLDHLDQPVDLPLELLEAFFRGRFRPRAGDAVPRTRILGPDDPHADRRHGRRGRRHLQFLEEHGLELREQRGDRGRDHPAMADPRPTS